MLIVAMFFSCGNDIKEVQDFLAEKNLPIGAARNVYLVHTDSGKVKTILTAPVMHDFSNRESHPYTLFPEGIRIISFDAKGDSVILTAGYSITFNNTNISEVKDSVSIVNRAENTKLFTSQLFWDSNEHYIYTEKDFTLITQLDTIHGKGFESNEDLSKVNMKSIKGSVYVNE
ncbi:LPS export ABC transporter periplasmic protein LptC [Lutimonas zeaxanthinifaciens]|uniref:LPS export ABC transporter periplasmic protein LptC n=1 Tax=Lutimonas zeaxanthinifaciens TaxID=3060215 RepID=UPI00265D5E11|nr:LPS export ABC transporter periplasmic protein LptC [Lutimonas sp. YSD2104]WKK66191.1 LPS export ABC transporter periplasmic protein LptC [Lutimonas sp. YSD2104]